MKLSDIFEEFDLPEVKVRKGAHELVRKTKRHEKDPRKKSRAQEKRTWKREVQNY